MERRAPQRMRITLIGSMPPARGVSAYTASLAGALALRDDVDLDVLSFRSLYPKLLYPGGAPDARSDTGIDNTLPVRRSLTWWNPVGWIAAGFRLRGDIVHAQWWSFFLAPAYAAVLAVARLRGKRVVLTVHNTEPHERGLLRRVANRAVLPFAHCIIVHALANARSLTAGRAAASVAIVPIGIAAQSRTPRDRADARAALGLPAHAPLVLFCGHIRGYKGVDVLFEAFSQVADRLPDAQLLVAGQLWRDAAVIEARADELAARLGGRVHARFRYLTGEELHDCYSAADLVVFPYRRFDAQSAAASDALAYGRAIVVTDVGGLPELVDDPAAVVPPSDARALAEAITRALTDATLRARLEDGAARRARSRSWDAIADATVAVYASLHGGARRTELQGGDA